MAHNSSNLIGLFDQNDDYLGSGSDDDQLDDVFASSGYSSTSTSATALTMDFDKGALPPEPQLGNVEYKLKLVQPTDQRFQHLVTQLKWRLREGHGEAIYEIGVSDSGQLQGLSDADMQASLATLAAMAEHLGASSEVLRTKRLDGGRRLVAEILVRKVPDDQHNIEVRVAVLGSADAGKSSLLGVLTHGQLDNGRGSARLTMLRHIHEIRSGRTSSVSHEILGFDERGRVINYGDTITTPAEIRNRSLKLVNFLDLAGHQRFLRTTVQGLSGYAPHYAIIVIAAGHPLSAMTREHLALVQALNVNFFVVVTKIDICGPEQTVAELTAHLTSIGSRRVPLLIQDYDACATASRLIAEPIVPVFCVSSVAGVGLGMLLKFLNLLQPGVASKHEKEKQEGESAEFHIDEIFNHVASNCGPVTGGLLLRGMVMERSRMLLGPLKDGSFTPVTVQTIHRNKAPCRVVRAGQSASLSFAHPKELPPLRSGMVLLQGGAEGEEGGKPRGSWFVQAKITVLYHATKIDRGFNATLHIGSIRQTAVIVGIFGDRKLATNDTESVMFRFIRHPEYVQKDMRVLFREGTAKGIGVVTQVFPVEDEEAEVNEGRLQG